MVKSKVKQWKLIVGIDFGTTYSGFAYKLPGKDDVTVYTGWEHGGNFKYKAPTCLLFNNDGSVDFGHKAVYEYSMRSPDDVKSKNYRYFSYFKMSLYREAEDCNKLSDKLELTSKEGRKMLALDVFTAALRKLKEICLEHCTMAEGLQLYEVDILWVLTVPAIWRDEAKMFMRKAAFQAGMIDKLESDHLVIALEPEAAGILCRTMPAVVFGRADNIADTPREGDSYLIIDAGGGTVDIAAMKVESDSSVSQLHYAEGGAHGGIVVNNNFYILLEEIFGVAEIRQFKDKNPSELENLMNTFEFAKWKFVGQAMLRVDLPYGFFEYFGKEVLQEKIRAYNNKNKTNIMLHSGKLGIPRDIAFCLFETVIQDIIKCINHVHQQNSVRRVKAFYLVGGFAESQLLFQRIKNAFPSMLVLRPYLPGFAVLKGATVFGENTSVVSKRVMSRCYGVKGRSRYDEQRHGELSELQENDLAMVNGVYYRRNVFFEYVAKGQSVEADQSVVQTLYTDECPNPDRLIITLFAHNSSELGRKYVTDDQCEYLGTVALDRKDKRLPEHGFDVQLKFGGTEIKVFIIDNVTKESAEGSITYFRQEEGDADFVAYM